MPVGIGTPATSICWRPFSVQSFCSFLRGTASVPRICFLYPAPSKPSLVEYFLSVSESASARMKAMMGAAIREG
ncbi:hypothetical protein D3C87_1135960 [compost metagenome]